MLSGIVTRLALTTPECARTNFSNVIRDSDRGEAFTASECTLPIEMTLSGMVIEVKLLQYLNASDPIEVTLSGIVMEVRLVQRMNAQLLISVTL